MWKKTLVTLVAALLYVIGGHSAAARYLAQALDLAVDDRHIPRTTYNDLQIYGDESNDLLPSYDEDYKRASWAPSEIRVDQFMQKLRSRIYNNRDKHSVGGARRPGRAIQTGVENESRLRDLVTDALLLKALRNRYRQLALHDRESLHRAPPTRDEEALFQLLSSRDGEEFQLPRTAAVKRTFGQIRSPREIHPVYLGLGQSAASAALNTYASLLEDDKRREDMETQSSSNPVRFIGKR